MKDTNNLQIKLGEYYKSSTKTNASKNTLHVGGTEEPINGDILHKAAMLPQEEVRYESQIRTAELGTGGGTSNTGNAYIPDDVGFESWLSEIDLVLPRSRHFLNNMIYTFYKQHPYVRNSIDLHAQITYSPYTLNCDDKAIQREYNDMLHNLGIYGDELLGMILSYFLFGESITVGRWSSTLRGWEKCNHIPPHAFTITEHEDPSARLTDPLPSVMRNYVYHRDLHREWQGKTMQAVTSDIYFSGMLQFAGNDRFTINPFFVWEATNRGVSSTVRGESLVLCVLNYLLYERVLMNANYRIARDRLKYPDLILVGDNTYQGYASDDRIAQVRAMFQSAASHPNAVVVAPDDVRIETSSSGMRLLPLTGELEYCRKLIALGLWSGVDESSGSRAYSYASEFIKNEVREQRYAVHRARFARLITDKILMPVAIARGYYRRKQADIQHNVRTTPTGYYMPKLHYSSKITDDDITPEVLSKMLEEADRHNKNVKTAAFVEKALKEAEESLPLTKRVASLYTDENLRTPKTATRVQYDVPTEQEGIIFNDRIRTQLETLQVETIMKLMSTGKVALNFLPWLMKRLNIPFDEVFKDTVELQRTIMDPAYGTLYMKNPIQYETLRQSQQGGKQAQPTKGSTPNISTGPGGLGGGGGMGGGLPGGNPANQPSKVSPGNGLPKSIESIPGGAPLEGEGMGESAAGGENMGEDMPTPPTSMPS